MAEIALHSKWGASKFESLMACPGKLALEAGLPNTTSKFAAEGTAAHQVLTWALQESRPAAAYIGRLLEVDGFTFEVDDDMAGHVQVCIDYVLELAGDDGVVLVDQRVNYSSYLGVPESDAWGTLDVAVLRDNVITAIDLKYGMGVEVSAGETVEELVPDSHAPNIWHDVRKPNPQVALYALGILSTVNGLLGDFDTVRLAISQPRISKTPSEYDISVAELEVWAAEVAKRAVGRCNIAMLNPDANEPTWVKAYLHPTEKGCKFCKAKATCPALRNQVVVSVSEPASASEFESITDPKTFAEPDLSRALSKCDLIEDWCKAVRAEVERRLLAGSDVPGFKLVQGKKGARAWSDEKEAEALLKSMRLKEAVMYDFSVKSPTQIAKLGPALDKDGKVKPLKEGEPAPVIGPRQWPKVAALITQKAGKPHVAPVSDPRPALEVTPVIEDFTDVTAEDLA